MIGTADGVREFAAEIREPDTLLLGSVERSIGWTEEKMLHKFLLIGASALALASSALAALPAVADDNDFFVLTQPNGKKIIIAPISIVAIWQPPQGVCKGETQIVWNFCLTEAQWKDLFALWCDRYDGRQRINQAERSTRIQALMQERSNLLDTRRFGGADAAAVTERLYQIGLEMARLVMRPSYRGPLGTWPGAA
jgi:hypothetical protein